ANNFADGEIIYVMLTNGIQSTVGGLLNPYSFSFTTLVSNVTKMEFMRSDFPVGSGSGWITSGDFNNDSWPDVAVSRGNVISVLLNNSGVLSTPVHYPHTGSIFQIEAADVDMDGDLDIGVVVQSSIPNTYYLTIFPNNGDGTFGTAVNYAPPPNNSLNDICFSDVNNDGYLDVLSTGYNKIFVFINNGNGQYPSSSEYSTVDYTRYPFSADFDNDGYNDIAFQLHNPQRIGVFLNNGNGTFGTLVTYAVNIGQPKVLKGADFNDDGYIDLVAAGDVGYRINVLLNNSDGTFGIQKEYFLPNTCAPKDIVCTDIDGDTDIDIVTLDRESYGGRISVLLNVGEGKFTYYLGAGGGYVLAALSCADFDLDGDMDPVAFELSNTSSNVSIFWNGGDVSELDFGDAPDPTYPTLLASNGARHVYKPYFYLGAIVDIENDGQPDTNALGDDNNGTPDDEDGVVFSPPLMPGTQDTLYITMGLYTNGFVNGWIDFNKDGDWDDANEHIIPDLMVYMGTYPYVFTIPADAVEGTTFARFRLSTVSGLAWYGQAPDGEVEDYLVEIGEPSGPWADGFEAYALGSDIVGQGGWQFWGGAPSSPGARVTNAQVSTGSQALQIRGAAGKDGMNPLEVKKSSSKDYINGTKNRSAADDILHQYNGCTSGIWLFETWQFIPADATGGTTYLIMLNQYDDVGTTTNWSTQVRFDPDLNLVESEYDGATLPLVKGSWVKIQHIIDLDNNSQSFYYNDQHLVTKSWTEGLSGGGILNIAAVNLFANTLENVDVYYDDFSLEQISYQSLGLFEGWSGISSFIDPAITSLETLLRPISDDLEIMYNLTGIYWPGQSINTMVNWDTASGYIIKVNDDIALNMYGYKLSGRTVYLNAGWNLIPVYSQVDAMAVLGSLPGFVVAKGIASSEILWPAFNIQSLETLYTGKAYLVYMTQSGSFTYPAGSTKSSDLVNNPQIVSTPWNDFHVSPSTHVVAFATGSLDVIKPGDIIGAFTEDGLCAGAVTVTNVDKSIALVLMGDDPTTEGIDGFLPEEQITYQLCRNSDQKTTPLGVAYHNEFFPLVGFGVNGLSVVTGVSLTGFSHSDTFGTTLPGFGIRIYPNPSNGIFYIDGNIPLVKVKVFNAVGKEMLNNEMNLPGKVDLMGQPKGIYFIRIISDNGTLVNKLIIE
nr:T9SS type A sorting domain-containing protein [Bacteroidota bacterium]